MANQQTLLSPAELAYLHSSLSLSPPIRPDGRSSKQFRPLTAETGILPGTNGSARVCLADGTEAIVGVKAEIEKTVNPLGGEHYQEYVKSASGVGGGDAEEDRREARGEWLEMTVEIPGLRDDDAGTVFLAELLREALLADGEFAKKLWINRRFHWRLYLDVSRGSVQQALQKLDDSFDITTTIVPPTAPLPHNTPRPPRNQTAATKIRRRRRPHVRRRLGGLSVPIPPPRRHHGLKTAHHAARRRRGGQHPIRPLQGGARSRRFRAGGVAVRDEEAARRWEHGGGFWARATAGVDADD
ncbi:3 exoribonuclease family rrp42 [Trichoderma arundinaceum]|uniref:Ribosomal RNA-processing protein 42 n=1 Tax=Trichoderma arundinaceum TaxID=490622 RepID=A0A395NXQ2_TRIAR|nr:3 exoribonuclease family rrp42 [Trichoderma arundinaceum]